MSNNTYVAKNSAQSYLQATQNTSKGSACGAGNPDEKQPEQPNQPSACGAADPDPKKEESSACGTSCGAGDK